jgi:hypothetical protein|tara:strand:+ start:301 stop:744 length:444 start_codon:yes stop_codon:yes gene_type:complete
VHIIDNIFSTKTRKQLIKNCKKVLERQDTGWWCPNISKHPDFCEAVNRLVLLTKNKLNHNLKVDNAWIAVCDGSESVNFHNHPEYDYSVIYYMQTRLNNSGTMFEKGFVKTKQNSLLIFDAKLKHKIPSYTPWSERKTLVLDIFKLD